MKDTDRLELNLHASGDYYQIASFLRSAADQIERDHDKQHNLPWYRILNGCGFMGDFKVDAKL